MNKIFPPMYSKPEKIQIFSLIPCWIFIFILIPMYLPFLGLGLWEQTEISVWLEIGYHVINGIAMLLIMSSYLKEEWFMVTTDVRHYLKYIVLTVELIVGVMLIFLGILHLCGIDILYLMDHLPIVEMTVSHTPGLTVDLQPIFGTISLSVFAPISICTLFYCFGFAPVCYKKPWLAYLSIALLTLIPPVIDILWRGDAAFVLGGYFVRLPIHLLACWSYQKTDNVWTPMISIAIINLMASIVLSTLY